MKKNKILLLLSCFLVLVMCFTVTKLHKGENIVIKTFIDGKLASGIPSSTLGYKLSGNISCTNGATATFNYSSWQIEVTNLPKSKTVCTVRFVSNKEELLSSALKNKVCSGEEANLNESNTKDCLLEENGLRYKGSNPNNYVSFNGELWRIIGVFDTVNNMGEKESLVKITRHESIGSLLYSEEQNLNWDTSNLKTTLNNEYLYSNDALCLTYARYSGDELINSVENEFRFSKTGIKNTARNMIEEVWWHLGGIAEAKYSYTAEEMYNFETGTILYENNKIIWKGRVGLIYLSDYAYSTLSSSCARTVTLNNYNVSGCAGNSWLHRGGDQWVMATAGAAYNSASIIDDDGDYTRSATTYGYNVYPTVYLKSSTKLMGGNGKYSNPYIII